MNIGEKMKSVESIRAAFEKAAIVLTDRQAQQFFQYYELLTEKNKVMNLTAITEFEEVVSKHFIDSVMLEKIWDPKSGETLIDVGTGAGFPGIPLKILYPELRIVLLDSLNKRVKFLNEVIESLGLKRIEAIHGRAEDFARMVAYREQFDCCVSRAVANLSVLSEYCLPFVRVGGNFVSYKSENIQEELNSAKRAVCVLGGEFKKKEEFLLPDSEIGRSLILIQKVKNTGKKYPRKAGMVKKEPIF